MKIAIVSASHRKVSRSSQIAAWVKKRLIRFETSADVLDLAEMDLPFWSEEFWNKSSDSYRSWEPFSRRLKECDGVVLISPEWAGMMPPKLGNFLLLCSDQELSYKPVFLIGVSAGASGTYPIAQLRMSASKNNQMVFLPDHLIVRNAEAFIKEDQNDDESHLNARLDFNLKVLLEFGARLSGLRPMIDLKRYPYGL
jgi:NAD(P)H-dependent FMN reductase